MLCVQPMDSQHAVEVVQPLCGGCLTSTYHNKVHAQVLFVCVSSAFEPPVLAKEVPVSAAHYCALIERPVSYDVRTLDAQGSARIGMLHANRTYLCVPVSGVRLVDLVYSW